MTEDQVVGWHHRLDGQEFVQAPGASDGQGSLACCSSLGSTVRHDFATEQQLLIFHMTIIMIMTITAILVDFK